MTCSQHVRTRLRSDDGMRLLHRSGFPHGREYTRRWTAGSILDFLLASMQEKRWETFLNTMSTSTEDSISI